MVYRFHFASTYCTSEAEQEAKEWLESIGLGGRYGKPLDSSTDPTRRTVGFLEPFGFFRLEFPTILAQMRGVSFTACLTTYA
jgi:hypothetical protein